MKYVDITYFIANIKLFFIFVKVHVLYSTENIIHALKLQIKTEEIQQQQQKKKTQSFHKEKTTTSNYFQIEIVPHSCLAGDRFYRQAINAPNRHQ